MQWGNSYVKAFPACHNLSEQRSSSLLPTLSSPSPTFLQQALDGGRVHPLLHISIVQHLVVG